MHRLALNFLGYFAATLILSPNVAYAGETTWPPATTPRQINVTSDSAAGWQPSEEQITSVRKAVDDFLAAKDGDRAKDAYALLADLNRQHQPFPAFADEIRLFNQRAGAVKERRVVTINWTKDPREAPAPGVYAAIDLVSRFENIDRHCGSLILYLPPSGGGFRVMREESNFLDNVTAKQIEREHSAADVDKAWSQLTMHCPNYPAELSPLPEQPGSSVGYPTVAAALNGLHEKPGVKFSSQGGWTIASEEDPVTIWSFVPAGDPAYPAVVKRQLVKQGGAMNLEMTVHCESTKQACDKLVRDFKQLNAQMAATLGSRQ